MKGLEKFRGKWWHTSRFPHSKRVAVVGTGATAVQVGTASYWDPRATEKMVGELGRWCAEHQISRIAELTGAMLA